MIPSQGGFTAVCERVLMKARDAAALLSATAAALWRRIFNSGESNAPSRPATPHGDGGPPPLIAFSFAGMLWAYLIGVVAFLQEHFDLGGASVQLSGVSCGTAAAMAVFLDLSVEQAFELGLGWQTLFDSRPMKFWLIRTSEALRMVMEKYEAFGITDAKLSLSEKYARWPAIHLGVTVLKVSWWRGWLPVPRVRHESLADFTSCKEMTYAAMCSCRTLPFFRTPGLFRGVLCVDGAYTAAYTVPEEYSSFPDRVVRVGILNLPGAERADISPSSNLEFAASEWCDSGSVSANVERFSKGYRDAAKLNSLLACTAKGLRWAGRGVHTPEALAKEPAAFREWQAHVDERVERWSRALRKRFA